MPPRRLNPLPLPLIAMACLGGCVPIPHYSYQVPTISGTIVNGTGPVVGARIEARSRFAEQTRHATTNDDGEFTTKAVRDLRFLMVWLGDPMWSYRLYITAGENTYLGYVHAGMGPMEHDIRLQCDLSQPQSYMPAPVSHCVQTDLNLSDAVPPR